MNLKELEYVVAIADEKSLTKAAERLFITPSALTQQVLRLENELHAPLFIRSRSGWQPTEAGEIYLEAARKILFIRQDAYNRLQDQIQRSAYSLTIGLPPERGTDMFSRIYALPGEVPGCDHPAAGDQRPHPAGSHPFRSAGPGVPDIVGGADDQG